MTDIKPAWPIGTTFPGCSLQSFRVRFAPGRDTWRNKGIEYYTLCCSVCDRPKKHTRSDTVRIASGESAFLCAYCKGTRHPKRPARQSKRPCTTCYGLQERRPPQGCRECKERFGVERLERPNGWDRDASMSSL